MTETPNTRDDSGMDLSGGLTGREAAEMAAAADELAKDTPIHFFNASALQRSDFQYPKNTHSSHETRNFDTLVAYDYHIGREDSGALYNDIVPGSEVYADLGYCKRCGAKPGLNNYTLTQKCAYAPE